MLSILPSVMILGLVALVAVGLARTRRSPPQKAAERSAAARALALTAGVQGVHFAEEAATGFNVQFPALLGLPAMSMPLFLVFNLVWLGIWFVSVPGLRSGRQAALFAAWFLALAGMLNGIAHPLMAVVAGGYFPGLVTSPFIGVAGFWLGSRLRDATDGYRIG